MAVHVFEALVTYDDSYQVIPQLAVSWDVSEDGLGYRFYLREGVLFHNGEEMKADDVVASIDRFRQVSPSSGRLSEVSVVHQVNDYTVEILLREPCPLLSRLAAPDPFLAIFPADLAKAYVGSIPVSQFVGTGPYRVCAVNSDGSILLSPFEDYVADSRFPGPTGFGGFRQTSSAHLLFVWGETQSERKDGLISGVYDYGGILGLAQAEELEDCVSVETHIMKPVYTPVIEINHRSPLLELLEFRKALSAGLDLERILRCIALDMEAFFRMSPGLLFGEQTLWCTDVGADIYLHYDTNDALELLAASGYTSDPLVLLVCESSYWSRRCAEEIVAELSVIGIPIEVLMTDRATQLDMLRVGMDWDLAVNWSGVCFDPLDVTVRVGCSQSQANGYCSGEADAMIERLATCNPLTQRQQVLAELQLHVWEYVPFIRIGDVFGLDATAAWIRGYSSFYNSPRFWTITTN